MGIRRSNNSAHSRGYFSVNGSCTISALSSGNEENTFYSFENLLKTRSGWLPSARRKGRKIVDFLVAERLAVAMFVFLVPSTRTCRANLVYMVLGSSYLSARKILSLGPSTIFCM